MNENNFAKSYSPEAEQNALGAIIFDEGKTEQAIQALELLNDDDFYSRHNQLIFSTVKKMVAAGDIIDTMTVADALPEIRKYVYDVMSGALTSNLSVYAGIVKQKSIERNMQELLLSALRSMDATIAHNEKLDRVHNILKSIDDKRSSKSQVSDLSEYMKDVVSELQDMCDNKTISGIKTGFHELDYYTGGFRSAELITLGARTSVGKSTLGLNIAQNVSKNGKARVLYLTFEMSGKELAQRAMCAYGRADNAILKSPSEVEQSVWGNLLKGAQAVQDATIRIAEMARPTVEEVKSVCRAENRKNGVDFIVIDHLHLMAHNNSGGNEVTGIGDTTASLKGLAIELGVPILLMAQLNRGNAKENRRPTITDLRGSGSIEQDSDRVLLLHRDDEDEKLDGKALLLIVKNRGGENNQSVYLQNSLRYFAFDNEQKASDAYYAEKYDL